jgi:hypothetical protein
MSLSSFLQENQDVRAYLRDTFPKPETPRPKVLLAPPRTNNYQVVGTAFDYYLRWHLQHLNRSAASAEWIAAHGCLFVTNARRKRIAAAALARARRRVRIAVQSGHFGPTLAESAIEMAHLDTVFRVGLGEDLIGRRVAPQDVADLRRLLAIVPRNLFESSICFLNPAFNAAHLVGGADADLVVGDTLIELKVTKDPKVCRDYFNQLLGYYLLFRVGGLCAAGRQPKIRHLGVYMARFGYLATWPLHQIASERTFARAAIWFRRRAMKENPE